MHSLAYDAKALKVTAKTDDEQREYTSVTVIIWMISSSVSSEVRNMPQIHAQILCFIE